MHPLHTLTAWFVRVSHGACASLFAQLMYWRVACETRTEACSYARACLCVCDLRFVGFIFVSHESCYSTLSAVTLQLFALNSKR
jgi:hypothetical protein